jgi:hypothetical protein
MLLNVSKLRGGNIDENKKLPKEPNSQSAYRSALERRVNRIHTLIIKEPLSNFGLFYQVFWELAKYCSHLGEMSLVRVNVLLTPPAVKQKSTLSKLPYLIRSVLK